MHPSPCQRTHHAPARCTHKPQAHASLAHPHQIRLHQHHMVVHHMTQIMSPATKPKLTSPLLQRQKQRVIHLETRGNHARITHRAPPSSTKKSSGFSLIVTPSLHVSEVQLPLNTHSIRNRFPRPLNTTRYPPFLHRTTLPANTADLISSKLTAFLSFHPPLHAAMTRTYRTMPLLVKRESAAP